MDLLSILRSGISLVPRPASLPFRLAIALKDGQVYVVGWAEVTEISAQSRQESAAMSSTYKAVLRGNRLEWSEHVPKRLMEDIPIAVQVTVLEGDAKKGQRMAEALENLARLNALVEIPDPPGWEREQRQDRQLPGRDS